MNSLFLININYLPKYLGQIGFNREFSNCFTVNFIFQIPAHSKHSPFSLLFQQIF